MERIIDPRAFAETMPPRTFTTAGIDAAAAAGAVDELRDQVVAIVQRG